jgi:acyl-[acyl-carrier-protein]-phospholipid O-acyltransferase/long-chain-fatty-acid--[acyl-carrier-protein] ligase
MMTMLFLLGVQATFFGPIKYSILPIQLRSDELIAGNGLIEAGTFLAILLGTIVGGVLILLPYGELCISIALLGVAVMGFVSSFYIPNTHIKNPRLNIRYNFLGETIRVIRYSKARWDIYLSILGISWFWLVGAVFLAEIPVFAKDILHTDEHVVTWFFAIFSIGIGIGSMLCNSLLKGKIHATYVPVAAIGITVFTIDLYVAARHNISLSSVVLMSIEQFLQSFTGWRISADLLLLAICGGIYTVPLYAILQKRSDEAYRARVIASNNIINALFMVLAAIGTLIMLKMHYTVNDVFLTVAMLNALVAIYICKMLNHSHHPSNT